MKIYIAGDHAGYDLKSLLIPFLQDQGHLVEDFGPHTRDLTDDYPDFIIPLARAVGVEPEVRGIIIGGNGQGEAVCANRIHGVRAAVVYSFNQNMIKTICEHDNANILSLGARFIGDDEAKAVVRMWLETPFTNDPRHIRRLSKIDAIS